MKKAIIGMAVGAMALGASVVPVSAGDNGYFDADNLWDGIAGTDGGSTDGEGFCDDDQQDIFEALILTGGWASRLDTDGNGKPRYTVFQPYDIILNGLLGGLGLEISDLNSQPAVVQGILADHIANGSFSPSELEDADLTRITMRSGFVARIWGSNYDVPGAIYPEPISPPAIASTYGERNIDESNVYIEEAKIQEYDQYDNGWLYCIGGVIDSTPQVSHEGLNSEDTPNDGTPGGTNSLPDTL
jgi:hypothetical protein